MKSVFGFRFGLRNWLPSIVVTMLALGAPPFRSIDTATAQGTNSASSTSCLRIVRNLLGGNSGNWGQAGAPVSFPDGGVTSSFTGVGPASFTLDGSTAGYSLLGVQVYFTKNSSYALRATVSNYTGNYPGANFEILGATPGSFSGVTHLNFEGDGVYALLFTYTGANASYLARIGINVDAGPSTATGPGGFTVSDLSFEQLPNAATAPSEYVTPGYAWGFNYGNLNSYDNRTGVVQDAGGPVCANSYQNVWAITADSFGSSAYDFPNQLANNIAQDYVFFVDSVPGRKLSTAQLNIDPLFSNTAQIQTDALLPSVALPSNVAKPNGLIVEGGVNDIVQGSTAQQLEAVASTIISDIESKTLSAILVTVSPFGNNVNWTGSLEQVRIDYNQWVRTQANQQHRIYVYDMAAGASAGGIADDNDPTVLAASFDIGDGLHPNLAGGLQIATGLKQILDAQTPLLTQTISFPSIADQALSASPLTVSAIASSGLPVTLTSRSPTTCAVSGSTITLIAAGICTIDANQAGNATYSSAPTVIRMFSIVAGSNGDGNGGGGSGSNIPPPLWALITLGVALLRTASVRRRSLIDAR